MKTYPTNSKLVRTVEENKGTKVLL
jgi:hypothetical protein